MLIFHKLIELCTLTSLSVQAMKCFSSWVEFGLPLPEVQGFVGQLLQGLVNDELFTQACNTLADIVSKEDSLKYVYKRNLHTNHS